MPEHTTTKPRPARETPLELPAEVWLKVIAHVRRRSPRPTGRAQRSGIRQHDLTSLMRVSKMLNNLTGSILYSSITIDHLPSLIRNIGASAAASGISSKRDLLTGTKRLFLEYADKSEPNYTNLMTFGGIHWSLVAPSREDTIRFCGAEADWMAQSALQLGTVFRALKTLSNGAYLGGQKDIWFMAWELPPSNKHNTCRRMIEARQNISALLNRYQGESGPSIPLPPACCQRVEYGPLTLQTTMWQDHGPGFSAHVESDLGAAPCVVGGGVTTRWYLTFNDIRTMEATETITKTIAQHLHSRESLLDGAKPRYTPSNLVMKVDMYLPEVYRDKQVQRWIGEEGIITATCKELGVPRTRMKGDFWKSKPMSEAPDCPACDWCIDDNLVVRQEIMAKIPKHDYYGRL